MIGEAGYEWDWSKNFNDFADDMDGDFKRALWHGLFSPTPVLPMSWWWEFFENRGMMSYFKPVSEMNRMMLEAGKGKFESFAVKTNRNEVHGLCSPLRRKEIPFTCIIPVKASKAFS